MRDKVFKTLDEQIEILKEKGLTINNIDNAKKILFRENYFFISGYRQLLMKNFKDRRFIEGTTFEELYAMFIFDRHIRNVMFKNILIIENNIKSIISYQLSRKYGIKEKDYLEPRNFTQEPEKIRQVNDVLNKMRRQIRVNGRQHSATMHYLCNYGYIPMWIVVKVLSLGIISELYAILKQDDQNAIAKEYKTNSETMCVYITLLSNFRNLCAHEDVLYTHRTQRSIPNNKYHYTLDIAQEEGEYIYGKNDLFALIIILKDMLSVNEFKDMLNELSYEIDLLDGRINIISLNTILNKIGFPDNWRDITKIN